MSATEAASVLAPWLAGLEAVRDGGMPCENCSAVKIRVGNKWVPGRTCPRCSGTGRLPPPDLIALCLQFADWLEERGWQGWGVRARPAWFKAGYASMIHRVGMSPIGPEKGCIIAENGSWIWNDLPRPSGNEMRRNEEWVAARLLMLFRVPCKSCLGSGRMTDGRDRREPSYGHIIECDGCDGLGYLPLPPDKGKTSPAPPLPSGLPG